MKKKGFRKYPKYFNTPQNNDEIQQRNDCAYLLCLRSEKLDQMNPEEKKLYLEIQNWKKTKLTLLDRLKQIKTSCLTRKKNDLENIQYNFEIHKIMMKFNRKKIINIYLV